MWCDKVFFDVTEESMFGRNTNATKFVLYSITNTVQYLLEKVIKEAEDGTH